MTYRVTDKTTGIEWEANGKTRRVESGQTASDFLPESVADLLKQGYIEEIKGGMIPEDDISTATLNTEELL